DPTELSESGSGVNHNRRSMKKKPEPRYPDNPEVWVKDKVKTLKSHKMTPAEKKWRKKYVKLLAKVAEQEDLAKVAEQEDIAARAADLAERSAQGIAN